MPFPKKQLLRTSILAILAAILVIVSTPFVVAGGLRAWIWWQARQQQLTVEIKKIDAPFLHPVVLHDIHIASTPASAFRIDVTAPRATISLNLRSILLRTRDRAVQVLAVEGLRGELHRNVSGASLPEQGWSAVQKALPANFSFDRVDLRIENGPTVIVLRNLSLNGNEIETGRFSAGEVMITSPWLRQTFSALRGSTTWQEDRLTIAGLSLAPGLDVQSITADLAHLSKQRVGIEFDVDAFGGKIRANVSNEWRAHQSNWILIGSATDISLPRTSEGLGFTDRINGILHACKFTFRGDPHDPTHATASLWTEITGLTWRNRAADVIMLGAALYNRKVAIQQLYVKQGKNQLTLSGEAAFPSKTFDWFNPDFQGDISASISNLGDFASLFGANAGDFAGEISIEGTMNARERKIGGHLASSGNSLSIFKTPIDSFAAKVNLKASELEIEQLELYRQNDVLRAQGKIELAPNHAYSGKATLAAANIGDYLHLFPSSWSAAVEAGKVNSDWSGDGNATSHSGTFHVSARGVRVSKQLGLLPVDAELEAAYAPGNIFFRQAHLTNEHASLNGFVTIASNYLQLQAVALDVNGKAKLRGNIFLPIAISKISQGTNLLNALDPRQKVDLDLDIEPTDLGEVATALTGRAGMTGFVAARLSIFGGLDALQGWTEVHLRDLTVANDAARSSAELDLRLAAGTLSTKAGVQFSGCNPLSLDASLPIRLGEKRDTASTERWSANLSFPALFLARLPRYLSHDFFRDGILSGKLAVTDTMRHPRVSGDVQLTNGKLAETPLHITEASGRLTFKGQTASIDFANLGNQDVALWLHGEANFSDTEAIDIRLMGTQPIIELAPHPKSDCISGVKIMPAPTIQPMLGGIDQIVLHGGVGTPDWTLTLVDSGNEQAPEPKSVAAGRTFHFCAHAEAAEDPMLFLGCEPRPAPAPVKPPARKRSRHR